MSFTSDAILVALELSNSIWLVGVRMPGARKSQMHRIDAGDTTALMGFLTGLKSRHERTSQIVAPIVCCFEAGRDGFWIQRFLVDRGIPTHVVEPTSILVNRRAKRAKTDRLDAEGLLRVLAVNVTGNIPGSGEVKFPTLRFSGSAVLVVGASVFGRSAAAWRLGGDWPDGLGQEVSVATQAIAGAFDLNDDGVM